MSRRVTPPLVAAAGKTFAGAIRGSAVHCCMIKGLLLLAAASFALCLSLSAQNTVPPVPSADLTLKQATPRRMVQSHVAVERTGSFSALNNVWYGHGPLTLVDGRSFTFPSAFGWVEGTPGDLLPTFSPVGLHRLVPNPMLPVDDANNAALDWFEQPDYVSGEVSVFYGKSIDGKFNREVKAGHLLGEIIHGNTHISVGAFYEESNGRRPVLIGR